MTLTEPFPTLRAAVLVGGGSTRMGRPKAWLDHGYGPQFLTNPVGHFALSAIKDCQSAGLHLGHLHQPASEFRLALIQHGHLPVRIHQPDRASPVTEYSHHSDTVNLSRAVTEAFGFFLLKTCVDGYCEQ